MLNCTGDPLENYLKSFGYSVVLLPREGIRPLQVATMKASRQLQMLGDLPDLFDGTPPPVPAIKTSTASNLSGAQSGGLNIGVGLKLLSGALQAIGVPPLSGSMGFDKANKMRFEFGDVTIESVSFLAISKFIGAAGRISSDATIKGMIAAQSIHVVTDVLRAQTLLITAEDNNGREAAIDVPAIKGLLDGKASVKSTSGTSSQIALTSATPLAFGIKAAQLFLVGRKLSTRLAEPDGMTLESADLFEDTPAPIYLDPDSVVAG
jgi:hypothetical protein